MLEKKVEESRSRQDWIKPQLSELEYAKKGGSRPTGTCGEPRWVNGDEAG
ncbi:hypothetical protein [Streptomyces sp. NPDC042319]